MRLIITVSVAFVFIVFNNPSLIAQQSFVLTLDHAVENALKMNRELSAVRHDRHAASYGIGEAKSAYLPQVNFQSQYNNSESDLFDFETPDLPPPFDEVFTFGDVGGFTGDIYANQFQFSQLIYDRSVLGNITISKLRSEAAQWQEEGQRQHVVFDVVSAYLDILRAGELLSVQQQRLQLANKQVETASTGFEAGVRIRTDVLRAQLTRSSALRDIVSAEIARDQAAVILNQIMGIPISDRYRTQSEELAGYNPPAVGVDLFQQYGELLKQSANHNPAIQVASLLLAQQEESVAAAKGEFYPRVSLGGNWGFRENRIHFRDEEWMFFVQVDVPIFEGGRKMAKIRRTHEELSAQGKRYEDTVRMVQRSVEQSALSLQEEFRNLQIAIEAEAVAQESHERFLNLYEEGLADTLDVTQSITEWVEAQTEVVTTRYGYMRVMAQLLFAMGTIPTESERYASVEWLRVSLDESVLSADKSIHGF